MPVIRLSYKYHMSIMEALMARPTKCRKVCILPKVNAFYPKNEKGKESVNLLIDEYEALRLIDYEKLMQEEAALLMQVARTTVQQIYAQARSKVATALIEGRPLVIDGGEYELCSSFDCPHKRCIQLQNLKKEEKMKILAIPVDENNENTTVCQVFARAPYFAFYNWEKDELSFVENSACEAEGGAALKAVQFLFDNQIASLLTVRLGQNAAEVLKEGEIEILKADKGTLLTNLEEFKKGNKTPLTVFHAGYQGI